jgi:hypothetical protein
LRIARGFIFAASILFSLPSCELLVEATQPTDVARAHLKDWVFETDDGSWIRKIDVPAAAVDIKVVRTGGVNNTGALSLTIFPDYIPGWEDIEVLAKNPPTDLSLRQICASTQVIGADSVINGMTGLLAITARSSEGGSMFAPRQAVSSDPTNVFVVDPCLNTSDRDMDNYNQYSPTKTEFIGISVRLHGEKNGGQPLTVLIDSVYIQ